MKFIPRKAHAILDLVLALILILYPWLFFTKPSGVATTTFLITGIALLWYSLMTKYEVGIFKFINMKVHLAIDFFLGLMLAASPWLLGLGPTYLWPPVVIGAGLMLLAVCTNNRSIPISRQEESITF